MLSSCRHHKYVVDVANMLTRYRVKACFPHFQLSSTTSHLVGVFAFDPISVAGRRITSVFALVWIPAPVSDRFGPI